tara:strand:+ start:543 stop:683 length:141 start_codon:yes stop_codon:yes gene_type:complete
MLVINPPHPLIAVLCVEQGLVRDELPYETPDQKLWEMSKIVDKRKL